MYTFGSTQANRSLKGRSVFDGSIAWLLTSHLTCLEYSLFCHTILEPVSRLACHNDTNVHISSTHDVLVRALGCFCNATGSCSRVRRCGVARMQTSRYMLPGLIHCIFGYMCSCPHSGAVAVHVWRNHLEMEDGHSRCNLKF